MQAMSRALGNDAPPKRHAQQGEVANDVQDFVAGKFVWKAQWLWAEDGFSI
jgi:hypothetical protein